MFKKVKKYLPKPLINLIYKSLHIYRTIALKGDNYFCPICKYKAKKFLPYGQDHEAIKKFNIIGMGYRENALCPNCFSKDRERLVFLFLKKLMKQNRINLNSKIIHFSPEASLENNLFRNNFTNYTTADIIKDKCDLNIDLQNFYYQEKNFDLVICNHVLEHIKDDIIALENIYSILKPGGLALLQVPLSTDIEKDFQKNEINTEKENLNLYGQKDHVRIFAEKNYLEKIEQNGFILEIDEMIAEKKNLPSFGLNFLEKVILVKK